MTVELIENKEVWDNFINDNPHSIIFHKWDILKIIERNSGYTLLPYAVYDGNHNILGVCPLFAKNRYGIRLIFSQPPGAGIPYIGIVFNKKYYTSSQHKQESYLNKFVSQLNSELHAIAPNFISMNFLPDISDIREFIWDGYKVNINYSYVINTERDLEEIWESFDRDCRREIRISEKYNLCIEQTTNVEKFFSIMTKRYNDQNLSFPFFSPEYLRQLLNCDPENIKCYFVLNDGQIVNLVLTYNYQHRVVFWKGWVNLNKGMHSNEYLTWEFIKIAKDKGFKELEIQGGNVGRLSKFKSKFNPILEPCFEVNKKDHLGKIAETVYLNILRRSA